MKYKPTVRKETIEIEEYTRFVFTYQENAINLTMALAQAGYFVQIRREGTGYTVYIYQHAR